MAPADRPDPQAQKQALITALNEHRINTIGELRRIERIFATLGSSDLTQPITSAFKMLESALSFESVHCHSSGVYYVNSDSLLTEMRGLTRNYPFKYVLVLQYPRLMTNRR